MNVHKNGRLTPRGRALLVRRIVEEGMHPVEAVQAAGVSALTAYNWRRYEAEGWNGLDWTIAVRGRWPNRIRPTLKFVTGSPYFATSGAPIGRSVSIAGLRYYQSLGIPIQRVTTDNGSCYRSCRFHKACRWLGLRHIRTKPYAPRTNGKAERFIQTALREWAYAHAYDHADQRVAHLRICQHQYNWHRPRARLKYQAQISVLRLTVNNMLGIHS